MRWRASAGPRRTSRCRGGHVSNRRWGPVGYEGVKRANKQLVFGCKSLLRSARERGNRTQQLSGEMYDPDSNSCLSRAARIAMDLAEPGDWVSASSSIREYFTHGWIVKLLSSYRVNASCRRAAAPISRGRLSAPSGEFYSWQSIVCARGGFESHVRVKRRNRTAFHLRGCWFYCVTLQCMPFRHPLSTESQ